MGFIISMSKQSEYQRSVKNIRGRIMTVLLEIKPRNKFKLACVLIWILGSRSVFSEHNKVNESFSIV